jgi:hypothetical protein
MNYDPEFELPWTASHCKFWKEHEKELSYRFGFSRSIYGALVELTE